jgi:hypothetical protein
MPDVRMKTSRISDFAAVAVGLLASIAFGADATPSQPTTQPANQQDLQAQVNELKEEVAQLKQQSQNTPADDAAAMQAMIADADRHSQLLDTTMGLTGGYANRRFFIQSEDGNFVLRPWIHVEIRDSTNIRNDFYPNGNGDTQNGFEIRRARFGFDGNFFTPDFTYFINWATNRENSTLTVVNSAGATIGTTTSPVGGLPVLEEAWVKYNFHDTPWYIHVGQMHDPLDHENIIGSKFRAPEASLQGDIFGNTDTFTQAGTVIFDDNGPIRVEGGITDGIRARQTRTLKIRPTTGSHTTGAWRAAPNGSSWATGKITASSPPWAIRVTSWCWARATTIRMPAADTTRFRIRLTFNTAAPADCLLTFAILEGTRRTTEGFPIPVVFRHRSALRRRTWARIRMSRPSMWNSRI